VDSGILYHHGNGYTLVFLGIILLFYRDSGMGLVSYWLAPFFDFSFLVICKNLLGQTKKQ